MARGKVVADGAPTEIKAMVGTRTIRATLPGADLDVLAALPGVTHVEPRGAAVVLNCTDSDAAIRELLTRFPAAHDIEISGAGLEQAFLQLTGGDDDEEGVRQATCIRLQAHLRVPRSAASFILSFGFPIVLYFAIAGPNRHVSSLGGTGISAPLYYMTGLAGFGTMNAMLATGARIAAERTTGWNRQLRITPLTTRTYFRAKVLTGYLVALTSLFLLYLCGLSLGVRMSIHDWFEMTLLILVGLIPFAALGILIGHLFTSDSIGPVLGGGTALFALLGGTWFPITNGVMHKVAEALPSYWLVQASHVALTGHGWGGRAWIVIGVWTDRCPDRCSRRGPA